MITYDNMRSGKEGRNEKVKEVVRSFLDAYEKAKLEPEKARSAEIRRRVLAIEASILGQHLNPVCWQRRVHFSHEIPCIARRIRFCRK